MKIYLTATLLFIFSCTHAQTTIYAKVSSNPMSGLVRTFDGKYALLSGVSSSGCEVYKIDSSGYIYWGSKLSFPAAQKSLDVNNIIQTTDSNFVGLLGQIDAPDFYLVVFKLDTAGSLMWVTKYYFTGSNNAKEIIATNDGGFIVVGGGCAGSNSTIRCDRDGNIIWKKQYRDQSAIGGSAFAITDAGDNNYYIGGMSTFMDTTNRSDVYVTKIDGISGAHLWSSQLVMPYPDWCWGVRKATDGGVTLVGTTFDGNIRFPFLAHFDSIGALLWVKAYQNDKSESIVYGFDLMSDGGYLISGHVYFGSALYTQIYIIRTDVDGNVLWARTSGNIVNNGAGNDVAECVKGLSNGSIAVCGQSDGGFFAILNNQGFGFCKTDTLHTTSVVPSFYDMSLANIYTLDLNFVSDTITYTFTSLSAPNSVLYCTDMVDIEEQNTKPYFSVYPNPSNGTFSVSGLEFTDGTTINVFNTLGELVYSQPLNRKQQTVNCKLNAGVYFVQVKDVEDPPGRGERLWVEKMMVE